MNGSTIPPEIDAESANILLVDDSPAAAQHTRMLVEALGHKTAVALNWTEALRLFTSAPFDLVLMDAVMPNMDGFRLTRLLREKSTSYVPIVFLTGLKSKDTRQRSIQAGADDVLTKPVDELELRLRVVAMLRIRRLTRALEAKSSALEQLARRDVLTGLLNRRELNRDLPAMFAAADEANQNLHVIMSDIDRFKAINDTHGHQVGDEILQTLGEVVQEVLRDDQRGYRYGGEEVCILVPNQDEAFAQEVGERVRKAFAERTAAHPLTRAQTLSVGLASRTPSVSHDDASALLNAADQALYMAKRDGRDCLRVYEQKHEPATLPP